jgi:hypothetical protein
MVKRFPLTLVLAVKVLTIQNLTKRSQKAFRRAIE